MIQRLARVSVLALASAIAPLVIVFAALAIAVAAELASPEAGEPVYVTPHLSFTVRVAPETVIAGERLSLILTVRPRLGMKVYAPGTPYRAVSVAIDADPSIRIHDTAYPAAEVFLFTPLGEEVLVYTEPFQLVTAMTAGDTSEGQAALRRRRHLRIRGELRYQACNATSCFLPESAAFEHGARVRH